MTAAEAWQKALADVLAGRPPSTIAPIVGVSPETVRRWLRGARVPGATVWRSLGPVLADLFGGAGTR